MLFVPISAVIIDLLVIPNINNYKLAISYLTLALVIGFAPLFLHRFLQIKKKGNLDKDFVNFLEDLIYYLELNYSVNEAVIEIAKNNKYSNQEFQEKLINLTNLLKKGVRLEKAFSLFIDSLDSNFLDNYKAIIMNTIKNNLNIKEFFETLKEDLENYLKRKEERKSFSYYSILNTYITYFVFLMLLVLLIKKVIPFGLQDRETINIYTSYLSFLIFEEAFLSGFMIGQISLNNFLEGVVHSFNLIGLSYIILMLL